MALAMVRAASTGPNGPVSLPLHKISHCTTPSVRAQHMEWKHSPNRDDMFAVFDTMRSKDISNRVTEHRVLKLICGSDQMVSLPFFFFFFFFFLWCVAS